MEDEGVAAVRVDQTVFGPAPKSGHDGPCEPLTQIDWHGSAKIRPARRHARNATAVENAFQAADCGLDFGKLGHARRYGGRQPSPLEAPDL
jgi:hypothetical protein